MAKATLACIKWCERLDFCIITHSHSEWTGVWTSGQRGCFSLEHKWYIWQLVTKEIRCNIFGLILVFLSSENILKRGNRYIFYHIRNPCLCGGAVALHNEHFTGLRDFCHFKFKPSDLQSFFKARTLWNIKAIKSHCPATKSSALNVSVATRL